MSDSDLYYFNKLKTTNIFQLKVTGKMEFERFKNEIINILKIEEKATPENPLKLEIKEAIDSFFKSMANWIEKNRNN